LKILYENTNIIHFTYVYVNPIGYTGEIDATTTSGEILYYSSKSLEVVFHQHVWNLSPRADSNNINTTCDERCSSSGNKNTKLKLQLPRDFSFCNSNFDAFTQESSRKSFGSDTTPSKSPGSSHEKIIPSVMVVWNQCAQLVLLYCLYHLQYTYVNLSTYVT
jgi:hypothetical protein